MKNEYIIINRTALKKRLKELKYQRQVEPDNYTQSYLNGKIKQLDEILSQSTPLIPVLEEAWKSGWSHSTYLADYLEKEKREDYIQNLKLDI